MEKMKSNAEKCSTLSSGNSSVLLNSNKNTVLYNDCVFSKSCISTLPLPSLTVTAPQFNCAAESTFSYFPRKFSFQAFRKLSGSSVSLCVYVFICTYLWI